MEPFSGLPFPAAAQRDIDIVLQPAAQGNVPSAPELFYAVGKIGTVEVIRKPDSEQGTDPALILLFILRQGDTV